MTTSVQVPDPGYLSRIGLFVYLVAELEGVLKNDLVRFQPWLPNELDYGKPEGRAVTGKTTRKLGEYFIAHATKSTFADLADYYRVGGEALVEISSERNAVLHSQPGVDGWDPEGKLRLMRWRVSETNYEAHMITDEWLDSAIGRIRVLRQQVVDARPALPSR